MPQLNGDNYRPDLSKCRRCIFLRIAFGVRCLQESPGKETIIATAEWARELRVPQKPFPQCQDEMSVF